MQKLMGVNMCSGSQMPKAGRGLPRRKSGRSSWICNGAPNNRGSLPGGVGFRILHPMVTDNHAVVGALLVVAEAAWLEELAVQRMQS